MASDTIHGPAKGQAKEAVHSHQGSDAEAALPPPGTRRWYQQDKQRVVDAVRNGVLDFHEACQLYFLSYEEFVGWERSCQKAFAKDTVAEAIERRRFHRIALGSPGSLRVMGRRIECDIDNLSASGALVLIDDGRSCPTDLTLEVPHSRTSLPARVAWRGRNALGVEFVAKPDVVASCVNASWHDRQAEP